MKNQLTYFLRKFPLFGLFLLIIGLQSLEAQQKVTGTVTDETGAPLPGASIVVQGTTNGTQTDFDGLYTLNDVEGNATLLFSYVGFNSLDVPVNNQTTLNVVLKEDAAKLDEVVVVGYGTQKKSAITGSVVKIDAKDLTKVSVANTTELIGGRVAGVITKQTSGVPGDDATTLNIRGFGTPLVLVDGMEMSLDRIDPNEIESINVLKDASAAIYGARAGNGVILVTTKRGRVGKPVISYSGITSFQQPTTWRNSVNGGQFVEMQNEGGAASYTPEEIALYKAEAPGYESYDWERAVFRSWAPMNQHNLSVRGGSEAVRFFTSLGTLKQDGQFKSGDLNYSRINVRSNVDAKINESLSFGIDISYRRDKTSEPGADLATVYNSITVSEPILPPFIPGYPELAANSGGGFNNRTATGNASRELSGFIDKNNEVLTGRIQLNYEFPFLKGLSAKGVINYNSQTRQTKDLDKRIIVYEYDRETQEPVAVGARNTNDLNEELYQFKSFYPSISLNFDREYGNHSVKGLL
ncbi:SusC/RagA family TonB-linked outer membrane protein [Zobellia uliginosa]|nr:SusC/RagA family TonB-linked outer membrane protein [Zobellia uliginosa]